MFTFSLFKAISDGKRIVTAHWLNDVLLAKVMFPPSNPLHLPVPFKDKVNQCKNMVSEITQISHLHVPGSTERKDKFVYYIYLSLISVLSSFPD